MLAGLALPTLAGYLIIGGWQGALAGLVWGGGVRVFVLHHVTFSINSICHFFGRRRFASRDESRNVWWLSLLSFGESWHNNHHAFPTSAAHGLKAYPVWRDPRVDGEALFVIDEGGEDGCCGQGRWLADSGLAVGADGAVAAGAAGAPVGLSPAACAEP
jgi:hypothetical protein